MLPKPQLKGSQGFTLIELMIVIAIIGILAAIAIPNFISYRNKSFCTQAESDANYIATSLGDHFAVPAHTNLPGGSPSSWGDTFCTGSNKSLITSADPSLNITITVIDGSGRCPDDYQNASPEWNSATDIFAKVMNL